MLCSTLPPHHPVDDVVSEGRVVDTAEGAEGGQGEGGIPDFQTPKSVEEVGSALVHVLDEVGEAVLIIGLRESGEDILRSDERNASEKW